MREGHLLGHGTRTIVQGTTLKLSARHLMLRSIVAVLKSLIHFLTRCPVFFTGPLRLYSWSWCYPRLWGAPFRRVGRALGAKVRGILRLAKMRNARREFSRWTAEGSKVPLSDLLAGQALD